ncbi:MAG: hypothetical protein RL077_3533 [Verrucomicrobiota bacterium]
MVGAIGFEPTTSWSQTRRSTRLSYTPRHNVKVGDRAAVSMAVLQKWGILSRRRVAARRTRVLLPFIFSSFPIEA